MAGGLPFEPEDDELDYLDDMMDDTEECDLCGNYYCRCCGCNCWMGDDSYEEESEVAE